MLQLLVFTVKSRVTYKVVDLWLVAHSHIIHTYLLVATNG